MGEMYLLLPSSKIVQAVMIRQNTWMPEGGAYFPYIPILKTLKIFSSETNGLISV